MRAFVDSDVLIWHLRGEKKALSFLRNLRDQGEYELWTGAMQRAEVVFFMRENEEEMTQVTPKTANWPFPRPILSHNGSHLPSKNCCFRTPVSW